MFVSAKGQMKIFSNLYLPIFVWCWENEDCSNQTAYKSALSNRVSLPSTISRLYLRDLRVLQQVMDYSWSHLVNQKTHNKPESTNLVHKNPTETQINKGRRILRL